MTKNRNDANGSKGRRAARMVTGCFKCAYCSKTFSTPQGRGGHCGLVHKKEMADFNREFKATVNGELSLSLAPPQANNPPTANFDLNLPAMDGNEDDAET